jgi:hypothetical protein
VVTSEKRGKFFQNFVAFSQYLTFICFGVSLKKIDEFASLADIFVCAPFGEKKLVKSQLVKKTSTLQKKKLVNLL